MSLMRHAERRRSIPWWIWPKLLGLVAVAFIAAWPGAPMILGAVALHVVGDYTFLPHSMFKARERGSLLALLIHSIIAGGLPGIMAGGWGGFAFCALSHFAIDSTHKFGRRDGLGVVLDQFCHVVVIVAAIWIFRG